MGDESGAGTTGVDDRYAKDYFDNIGAEIMGAGKFGVHAFPDNPDWRGWWGEKSAISVPGVRADPQVAAIPCDEGGDDFPFHQR